MKKILLILVILSLSSCKIKKVKYCFELTMVTGNKVTECYYLDEDAKCWIGEHRGSYMLKCTGFNTGTGGRIIRSAVIDYKILYKDTSDFIIENY